TDALILGPPSSVHGRNEQSARWSNQSNRGRLARRISAYLARLPNLSEGQGRDDVAFHFAAFLVRKLQLSDDQALSWLSQWDSKNNPPKGGHRLREIIANAHRYGRSDYGSGLSSCATPIKLRIPQWEKHPKQCSIRASIEL